MNIYTVSFLLILILNLIKNRRSLTMLQKNLYNENNRYLKWVFKNWKTIFVSLDFISFIFLLLAYILDNDLSIYLVIISFIIYLLEITRILNNDKLYMDEKKLVITKRVKRLLFTLAVLFLLPIIFYLVDDKNIYLTLVIEGFITYFSYLMVVVAEIINIPVERIVYNYYAIKAKNKLKDMKNLKVIGITGSYGKTTCKNILSDILNVKYIARPTPRNLNTKYGLMLTINNYLDRFDDIFIAEMGASRMGDIKSLCDMVQPKYGVLTRIGLNHLDTFGSPQNILETKFELIDNLPSDGVAILNIDDKKQSSYRIKSKCKKIWIGIENENADIRALNIKYDYQGTKFEVKFKDEDKSYPFETKLLGKLNIYNILTGIALGKELGISIQDLQLGVSKIKNTSTGLELKDYGYMYQMKDFSVSTIGIKDALDTLKMMPGIKVVVTKEINEIYGNIKEFNHMLGNRIADISDYIILVDEKKSRLVFEGIQESGYDKEKLFIVNDISDAYNLLQSLKSKKDMYVLFLGED